jgi:anti-sigma B factor antagonist
MLDTTEYFDVGLEHGDVVTTVTVTGEVDLFAAPKFAAALGQASAHPCPVLVDLMACTFFDSGGLHALLRAHREAEVSGRRITIACPAYSPPARLLEVTVPDAFEQHATPALAFAALAA